MTSTTSGTLTTPDGTRIAHRTHHPAGEPTAPGRGAHDVHLDQPDRVYEAIASFLPG